MDQPLRTLEFALATWRPALGPHKKKPDESSLVEPGMRFELTTCALRERCSTPEPPRREVDAADTLSRPEYTTPAKIVSSLATCRPAAPSECGPPPHRGISTLAHLSPAGVPKDERRRARCAALKALTRAGAGKEALRGRRLFIEIGCLPKAQGGNALITMLRTTRPHHGPLDRPSIRPPERPLVRPFCFIMVPLVAYSLACLTLFCTQDRLVFRPSRELDSTPDDVGLPYTDLHLTTSDGVRIHAWVVERCAADGWILYCHGNSANLSSRVELTRFVHDAGYNLLIFDYRGYGRSEGAPSEDGLYMDAWCAWQHLRNDREVPAERILVVGDSLGGAVAAALAEREAPAGLILAATFTSMLDLAQELYPYFPIQWICRHRFETRKRVEKIDCPKLILHSPDDEVIASHHGWQLFEASKSPREWCVLEGEHATHLGQQPPLSRQAILDFARRVLS
jgi:uncharacterized protein